MFIEEEFNSGISDTRYLELLEIAEKGNNRKLVSFLNQLLWLGAKYDEMEEQEDKVHELRDEYKQIKMSISSSMSSELESKYQLKSIIAKSAYMDAKGLLRKLTSKMEEFRDKTMSYYRQYKAEICSN